MGIYALITAIPARMQKIRMVCLQHPCESPSLYLVVKNGELKIGIYCGKLWLPAVFAVRSVSSVIVT